MSHIVLIGPRPSCNIIQHQNSRTENFTVLNFAQKSFVARSTDMQLEEEEKHSMDWTAGGTVCLDRVLGLHSLFKPFRRFNIVSFFFLRPNIRVLKEHLRQTTHLLVGMNFISSSTLAFCLISCSVNHYTAHKQTQSCYCVNVVVFFSLKSIVVLHCIHAFI